MVQPIHTSVRGRGRYKINGLVGGKNLKTLLEIELGYQKDIHRVSANTITGNLLVVFNPKIGHHDIAAMLEHILSRVKEHGRSWIERTDDTRHPARRNGPSDSSLPPEMDHDVIPWHSLGTDDILNMLTSNRRRGLTDHAAQRRLESEGLNFLVQPVLRTPRHIFLEQFQSVPMGLMGATIGISLVSGGLIDAALIAGITLANAFFGYMTEIEAEKVIRSAKEVDRPLSQVIRDGQPKDIPGEKLVVGDILVLKPGTYIGADSRVFESSNLMLNESVLTGESMPVYKTHTRLDRIKVPLTSRTNMVYMGTVVTAGDGLAVVVEKGGHTELGHLQMLLEEATKPETPIERHLNQIGNYLIGFAGMVGATVLGSQYLRRTGLMQALKTAVSLGAVAIPTGLPAAATVNFALRIRNLKQNRVTVRHLQALETLGSVQVICFDKTGTITRNRISVIGLFVGGKSVSISHRRFLMDDRTVAPLSAVDLREIIYAGALCNEAEVGRPDNTDKYVLNGSPPEKALLHMGILAGADILDLKKKLPILDVRYRPESRMFVSTLHATPDGRFQRIVRGNSGDVLALCNRHFTNGRVRPLTPARIAKIETRNAHMTGQGLRVLGVARTGWDESVPDAENELIWLGLIAMAEPIRQGAGELMRILHQARVRSVMITGDQSATAYAVAQRIGLAGGQDLQVLDSSQLLKLKPDLSLALIKKAHIYSRVSPAQKLSIVHAFQRDGKVVGMTGDGMNDSPALRAADIGIVMGKAGTDVARDVADMVLDNDDLSAIATAIREGRRTHENIKKSVHYFLSATFSDVLFALLGSLGGPFGLLASIDSPQLEVVTGMLPGLALAMEPAETDILEQPPLDPEAPIFSLTDYGRMGRESAVIGAGALGTFAYGLARYGAGPKAGMIAAESLLMGKLLHALNCRSETRSTFERRAHAANPYLSATLAGSLGLRLLSFLMPGFRRFFGGPALGFLDIVVIGLSAIGGLAFNDGLKQKQPLQSDNSEARSIASQGKSTSVLP